jgi:hypothetical protein
MDGMSLEKSVLRDCFPHESARLGGTWYFRLNSTRQTVEFDVIVLRTEDWPDRKEFRDRLWCPMEFGDLTVAVKARC